jgi:RNA polymerase sigma factor (sigma-70 family)
MVASVTSKMSERRVTSGNPETERRVTCEQIREHMHLVRSELSRFLRRVPRHVTKDDLQAAGTIGLFDALRRSSSEIPTFRHYASVRIRGAMYDELRKQDWLNRRTRARAGSDRLTRVSDENLEGIAVLPEEDLPEISLECLPPRERHIVSKRVSGALNKDIAAELGVSEERISQIYRRAVRLLREAA